MVRNRGFIGILVLIVVALALLKYFLNWDVFDAASTEEGRSTILYIREIFNKIWSFISAPVVFVWERIIWPILYLSWQNLQKFIEMGRNA